MREAALQGTGVVPIVVQPGSLAFGNQRVTTTGAAQPVTMTNNRSTSITLNISKSGANPAESAARISIPETMSAPVVSANTEKGVAVADAANAAATLQVPPPMPQPETTSAPVGSSSKPS